MIRVRGIASAKLLNLVFFFEKMSYILSFAFPCATREVEEQDESPLTRRFLLQVKLQHGQQMTVSRAGARTRL